MQTYAIIFLSVFVLAWATALGFCVAYILRWMNKNEAEYQKCRKECERGVRQDNHA